MDFEELTTAFTEAFINLRNNELHGYVSMGESIVKDAKLLNLSPTDLFDLAISRGEPLPFSKAGCLILVKLYESHPSWAKAASNVAIDDLSEDEQSMIESLSLEGMSAFCTENGIDPSFLYEDNEQEENN